MKSRNRLQRCNDERGTVLILALVFLVAIALVILATAAMAVGAQSNTVNTRSQVSSQINDENAVSLALQATRSVYGYSTGTPSCSGDACYGSPAPSPTFSSESVCTPSAGGISGITVWCEGSGGSKYGSPTRTVDFYVCASGVNPCAGSSKVALFAEAVYTDLPPGEPQTADQCAATSTNTCGISTTITAWDVRGADA